MTTTTTTIATTTTARQHTSEGPVQRRSLAGCPGGFRMPMQLRIVLTITALIALAACQTALADAGGNRYIVVLKDDAQVRTVLASYAKGTSVFDVYQGAVNGFAARLNPKTRAAIAA